MNWKMVVACAVLVLGASALTWGASDGASLYKGKCAACHGANGEGKPSMKAPALKGTTLDVDKLSQHIMKGEPDSKPPHNKGISGLSDDQARAIAEYIKKLQ